MRMTFGHRASSTLNQSPVDEVALTVYWIPHAQKNVLSASRALLKYKHIPNTAVELRLPLPILSP